MYLEDYIYLNHSTINGTGIFTSVDIPAGSIIMVIRGEVISEKECIRREEEENNVYIFWNEYNYIDTKESGKIKYLNHNCAPNCYVEEKDYGSLFLISEKDIRTEEELTIDYGYEEIYEDCACGGCCAGIYV